MKKIKGTAIAWVSATATARNLLRPSPKTPGWERETVWLKKPKPCQVRPGPFRRVKITLQEL